MTERHSESLAVNRALALSHLRLHFILERALEEDSAATSLTLDFLTPTTRKASPTIPMRRELKGAPLASLRGRRLLRQARQCH
jgi:hypothetical protein